MRALEDAEEEAHFLAEQLRRAGNPQRRSVYLMDGCDCIEQGGTAVPYHVHAFTWEQYRNWHAQQATARPIRSYPAGI